MQKPIAPFDAAALLAVALIWGINNVLSMAAMDYMPPMLFAGARFLITAIALILFLRLPQADWRMLLLIAALSGPLHFAFVYAGFAAAEHVTPVVIAAQLWIPFAVALAAVGLKERVGPLRGAGVALSFLGVAAMGFDPVVFAQGPALGLIAFAALLWGLVSVLLRRFTGVKPLNLQAWTAVIAFPPLLGASAIFETGQVQAMQAAPWWVWATIAFAGLVSSVVANAYLFRLVQKYEVARTTPFLLSTPVFSAALGVAFMGDHITAQILAGAAIALVGVALCALAERRTV
jgi:O-acetylserine/cysteine efflux transporter